MVLPWAAALTNPEVLMVAEAELVEDQVAEAVRSIEVPSLRCPLAVNCCVEPFAKVMPDGITAIEVNVTSGLETELPAGLPPPHPSIAKHATVKKTLNILLRHLSS